MLSGWGRAGTSQRDKALNIPYLTWHSRPIMPCGGHTCDAAPRHIYMSMMQRPTMFFNNVPYCSNCMSLFCVGTEFIQVCDGSTVCSWLLAPGHKARAIVTVCCVLVFNKKP